MGNADFLFYGAHKTQPVIKAAMIKKFQLTHPRDEQTPGIYVGARKIRERILNTKSLKASRLSGTFTTQLQRSTFFHNILH